jgi:hypothetical protein
MWKIKLLLWSQMGIAPAANWVKQQRSRGKIQVDQVEVEISAYLMYTQAEAYI